MGNQTQCAFYRYPASETLDNVSDKASLLVEKMCWCKFKNYQLAHFGHFCLNKHCILWKLTMQHNDTTIVKNLITIISFYNKHYVSHCLYQITSNIKSQRIPNNYEIITKYNKNLIMNCLVRLFQQNIFKCENLKVSRSNLKKENQGLERQHHYLNKVHAAFAEVLRLVPRTHNIVKMVILQKSIYRFSEIPTKISGQFFTDH